MVGGDIVKLTAVMGVFLAGFFLILFFLIHRLVRSRVIRICAFLAMSGAQLWFICRIYYDPYFQYWPHRVLFPGLLLLVVWFYQKASGRLKRILYYSAFVIVGIALLWNPETGLVAFGTWVLFLYWETLGQWRALRFKKTALAVTKHTLIALTVAILPIASLYIYTFLRSGAFPDIGTALRYQELFYGKGFFMIPMPLIHPWNLVILTFMVGIYISFSRLARKTVADGPPEDQKQTSWYNMVFIVSIMAAGLFVYYQGRSHDYVLLTVFWPVFFLIALFTDALLEHFPRNFNKSSPITYRASNITTGLLFLLLSFTLVFYASGIVELFPKFAGRIQTQIQEANQPTISHAESVNFMGKYFSHGDQVLILSIDQAAYYMESGTTNPLAIPGFAEIILKSDKQKVVDYLLTGSVGKPQEDGQPGEPSLPVRVIMGDDFEGPYPDLFRLVNDNYKMIDRVNDLTLYEQK
jgi:hypothetical protein